MSKHENNYLVMAWKGEEIVYKESIAARNQKIAKRIMQRKAGNRDIAFDHVTAISK